ncbi:glycosyltransferase [Aeromicrobium sp.]|uniref:glycosyltransferase n=1 Tax=Aeromicrobium sp. TaxID=1871063 RepID=UPI0019ACCA18|nr:glycosyltransferase [Aeromicrobium sp.]MBC7630884.1 glycosyltransferase [Aeromicrobium sp.]
MESSPGVSVIMPTYSGAEWILRALESIGRQTLAPHLFEVIIVPNGPDDGTMAIVREFQKAWPELTVRVFRLPRPSISQASNLGIAAARLDYITMIDDDDWVSPGYLDSLLKIARPDTVAQAYLADVEGAGDCPDFDNYINHSIACAAGQTVHPAEVPNALSFNTSKLVASRLARQVQMRDLPTAPDIVFWHQLVDRFRLSIRVVDHDAPAIYYRFRRGGSHSRPHERTWETGVLARLDAIAALQPIALDPSRHLTAVSAAVVRSLARATGNYMMRHPDEHGRLMSEVAARALDPSIWKPLNHRRAKDLAIAYAFPPASDTSALVAARRLRERGVAVDVVSHNMAALRSEDSSGSTIIAPYLGRHTVVSGKPVFASWPDVVLFCRKGMAAVEHWELSSGIYRSVYSRAMWPASHVLAAMYRIRRPAARWVAEFSDPLSRNIHHEVRPGRRGDDDLTAEIDAAAVAAGFPVPDGCSLFQWIEHVTFALADELMFTNVNQRSYMLDLVADPALRQRVLDRSVIAPHPTLPPEFYEMRTIDYPLDRQKVHVAYFGAFYATRGLAEVLEAMRQQPASERSRLVLHVFTGDPEAMRTTIAHDPALRDCVRVNPYVSYLEFLNLTTRFDCLLVNDVDTSKTSTINPYLPSKLSDYRGSGTPIWAIVEPDSILSQQFTDHQSLLGDVAGAARVLGELTIKHAVSATS